MRLLKYFFIFLIFYIGGCVTVQRREIKVPITKPKDKIEILVGPKYPYSRWRYITIHHSATDEGSACVFDRYHRQKGMGGLFYHFVIGNGTGSGDGELEVGWRWKGQVEVNRPYDIQICLVGNFNKAPPTEAQMKTLIRLINVLRRQYNIPIKNIRRHKDVAKKPTECPGKFFPFYRLLRELEEEF